MRRATQQRKLIPIKQAIYMVLAFGTLAASVMLFFVEPELTQPFFGQVFNLYRAIIMTLAVVFLLLATKTSWLDNKESRDENPRTRKILHRLGYIVPILTIAVIVLQLVNPDFAALLIRKEDWPFYRNGIFIKSLMQLVGAIAFIMIARKYARNRQWLAMALSILVTLVFVVMIGEELSWGQRIFGWTTPEAYAEINAQGETNLHNLATQVFQNVLYFGGWLIGVGLAFWSNTLKGVLNKFKPLRFLIDWLPPLSFVLIFAAGFGFGDPVRSETGPHYGSNLFIIIATAILLIALCVRFVKYRDNANLNRAIVIFALYMITMIFSQFVSRVWESNAGAATEWLEIFVNLALMSWALVINSRLPKSNHR